jgi:hypothetical protein
MPKFEPIINIENIVASATVKHGIELNSVVKAFPELSAELHSIFNAPLNIFLIEALNPFSQYH